MSSPNPAQTVYLNALERIEKSVTWYQQRPRDYNDVDKMLHVRKGLACALFELAVTMGLLSKEKNRTEFNRKSAFTRRRQELIGSGLSVSGAVAQAEDETLELKELEQAADADFHATRLVYDAGAAVLDTMCQHIAYLRQEKRLETTGQGSQTT